MRLNMKMELPPHESSQSPMISVDAVVYSEEEMSRLIRKLQLAAKMLGEFEADRAIDQAE